MSYGRKMRRDAGRGSSAACRHRSEAMGIILGMIDMARTMRPAKPIPIDEAMEQWASMMESAAREHYGDDWGEFVAHVRKQFAPKPN